MGIFDFETYAYKAGFEAGKRGGTWFDCRFSGRMMWDWLRGFDDGRNASALGNEF
jgi:hypothetical protein